MRTAEQILSQFVNTGMYSQEECTLIHNKDVIDAINEARKEAIEECAEMAGTDCDIYNHSVDKESILSLINELK